MNDVPERTPTLIKAALAHVQFETIHPFLDGNGRVGRLLVPMLFCIEGVLREPLLYLSLYLEQHRDQYYRLRDRVRTEGEWEEWLQFFVTGVEETANAAVDTAHRLRDIAERDRASIQAAGRIAGSALRVHLVLLSRPLNTISRVAGETRLSVPTITTCFAALMELGLVREVSGRRRGRIYSYAPYLEVLQQGTEPR